jgi:hypothetical protein
MRRQSFGKWLLDQTDRNDRVGDLARDASRDRDWPQARSLRGFQEYLRRRKVGEAVLESLGEAWAEWSALDPPAEEGAGR